MGLLSNLFKNSRTLQPVRGEKLFSTPYAQQINAHFQKVFPDRAELVWQDQDGMEIHLLSPTAQEPYYVAYTVGMSANLMEMDNMLYNKRYGYLRCAELMMYLPAEWPMACLLAKLPDQEPNREACWPLRMLYKLACMPQKNHTWLGQGHTVPNGDPPKALADNTGFCGAALFIPAEKNGPKEVQPVTVGENQQIMLYVAVPLYEDEMNMKLVRGADILEADLRNLPDYSGFIVNTERPSVARLTEKGK